MIIKLNSKNLFFLALASLLFVDIGFLISGYKITLALLFFLLSFFFMRLSIKSLILVGFYFVATIISSFSQIGTLMLVKIFLVCFMMASISSGIHFKIDKLDKEHLIIYFERIFQLVFALVLVEFLIANIFGISIYNPSRLDVTYGSIVRPFFLFTEPSILSIYAVFSFVVFDLLEKSASYKRSHALSKIFCVLIVLFTVSLTGILMLLAHHAVYLMRFIFYNLNFKNLFIILFRLLLIIFFGLIVFLIFPEVFDKLYSRLVDIINVSSSLSQLNLNAVNLNSSVGYRLLTVFSIFDYANDGSYFKIFFGEGFLNFNSWIIDRYAFFVGDGTIIEDGDVTNLLAVIFLSGGIIGTLLFGLYIVSLLNKVSLDNKAFLLVFIFCFMLVYGAITEPHLFIFIFIFITLFNKKNAF